MSRCFTHLIRLTCTALFRTEFYPTYDYKAVAEEARKTR
jgi:hypothetical protein